MCSSMAAQQLFVLFMIDADCWAEPENRPSCQEILTRLLDCEYAVS
jgi:hypothetical protein